MNKHSIKRKTSLNNLKRVLQIMRISLFFLFFSVLFSSAINSYSQGFTLNLKSTPIKEVCKEIEKRSDYIFVFSDNSEKMIDKKVDVNASSKNIMEVLNAIFNDTGLVYRILDNQIVVFYGKEKKEIKEIKENTQKEIVQQKKQITGTVVDEKGEAIIGANIVEVGTTNGTTTDIDGNFSLAVENDASLRISYIGYIGQNINSKGKKTLNIILKEDTQGLDEVVVTGYQVIDKRESASSVYTVKAADVLVSGTSSIEKMLQGEIPGMAVLNTSGEPSATPKIRIRGNATINGNKSPVWVVDGVIVESAVPFSASDLNSEDAEYLIGSAISGLNPQDIETITVLKDASATAIYGVKAANGVIVITTKKGISGKTMISYNGDFTLVQSPSYRNFDRMNSQERMLLSKEIGALGYEYPRVPSGDSYEGVLQELYRKKITQGEFEAKINALQQRNTNWYGILFRPSVTNIHNINISGGSQSVKYYFSVGYNKNLGAAKGSDSERITSLAKINMRINSHIDFQAKIDFSTTNNKGYHETINPHQYAYSTSRTLSPYNEDGSFYLYNRGNGLNYNFLKELSLTGQSASVSDFSGLFDMNVKVIDGLTYKGVFSYQNSASNKKKWAEQESYYISNIRGYEFHQFDETSGEYQKSQLPYGGILDQSAVRRLSYTIRNTLSFAKLFTGEHDIHAMSGVELRSNKYMGFSSTGYGWNPSFGERFMPIYTDKFINQYVKTGLINPINTNSVTQVVSAFGTLSYSYKFRYVVNANIRSDGSNKFGSNPKYRWLPTWSVAGKWSLSEENFMKRFSWINNLSIRTSYGVQGNIHDNSSPELIIKVSDKDGMSGLDKSTIYRLPNPDLRWEKTNSWNVAMDFGLLANRIKGSLELYKKHTKDLIHSKTVATSNGRSLLTINSGEMENYGFEGFIGLELIKSKLFDWRVSVNFAQNKNNVIAANKKMYSAREEVNKMLAGEIATEGAPIGSMYSFRFAGLSPENGFPLFYAKDGRKVYLGDPQLLELVNSGSIFSTIYGGFDTQIVYNKNLSLSLGFAYDLGGIKRLPNVYEDKNNVFDPLTNVSKDLNNRWKKTGDEQTTSIPAIYNKDVIASVIKNRDLVAIQEASLAYLYPTELYNLSDQRTVKTDFLRLRTIAVSYMFPQETIKVFGINSAMMRLQASNLHIWTNKKWKGLDPETPNASIPILPSYSFSVNISF